MPAAWWTAKSLIGWLGEAICEAWRFRCYHTPEWTQKVSIYLENSLYLPSSIFIPLGCAPEHDSSDWIMVKTEVGRFCAVQLAFNAFRVAEPVMSGIIKKAKFIVESVCWGSCLLGEFNALNGSAKLQSDRSKNLLTWCENVRKPLARLNTKGGIHLYM